MTEKQRKVRAVMSPKVQIDSPAYRSIYAFGSPQIFRDWTGYSPATVHGWLVRGKIPPWRHDHIIAAAQRAEIAFDPAWLQVEKGVL